MTTLQRRNSEAVANMTTHFAPTTGFDATRISNSHEHGIEETVSCWCVAGGIRATSVGNMLCVDIDPGY